MCDPQLGMGDYEQDVQNFKLAVSQINALKPDFVIICGDLVHHAVDSTYKVFWEMKEQFNIPCYLAAGNHDVGKVPTNKSLRFYRKKIGKDYYDFNYQGVSFIVTNSQLWKSHVKGESEKHDKWFRKTLSKSDKKGEPVIVVGHYPIFLGQLHEEETYSNLPLKQRLDILNLFAQNNVKAYLSGHSHSTLINTHQNIQLVSGETTSKNFDKRPFGFRLWEIYPDTIKHHFVPLMQNF